MTDQTVVEPEVAEEKPLSELETVATDLGWTPKDKWSGKEDKWIEAETYLRNREGMLKSALSRQDGELASVRSELAEVGKTLTEFKGYYHEVDERAYKRAKADLEKARRSAVEDGDADAVDRIQNELDDLHEPSKPNGKDENTVSPEAKADFDAFVSANAWYEDDYEMGAFADQIAPRVGKKFQGKPFYDELAKVVREKFPDRFENPNRKRAQAVEESGGTSRKKGGKDYSDLPPEAKAACDRFVKQGLMKKEDYVRTYDFD